MEQPSTVIIKLVARCNLNCDYCYMFAQADKSFLHKPAIMDMRIFTSAINKLNSAALKYGWKKLNLSLHGGETLLAGKKSIQEILKYTRQHLDSISNLSITLQTNATLLDREWADILAEYGVTVGISLDGPPATNDQHRKDHKGGGSYEQVIRGLKIAQQASKEGGFKFGGVLAVINPLSSGQEVFEHFVDDLGIEWMDFLLPDLNYDNFGNYYKLPPLGHARFLQEAFDVWWNRNDPNIHVRVFENIIDMLLGRESSTDSLGSTMSNHLVIETDGSMEPLDVLRIIKDAYTRQDYYIDRHSLEEFNSSTLIKELAQAAKNLPLSCQTCQYQKICNGGYLPHRYSSTNGFRNPSFHCHELRIIIDHIWRRILEECKQQENFSEEVANAQF